MARYTLTTKNHFKIKKNKSKILHVILFLFFTIASNLQSSTDKTYYSHRPQNDNIPLEIITKNLLLQKKPTEKLFITPFADFSLNHSKLASYLMFDNRTSLNVGRNTDIDNRNLKFDETSATNLAGTIKLKPQINSYGLMISYHQPLRPISKDFFVKINLPFVYVRFKTGLKTINATPSSEDNKTILDYFNGEIMFQRLRPGEDTLRTLQDPLEHGKIANIAIDKTGLADINLIFSYKTTNKKDYAFNLNGFLTVPTNSTPHAEYLFEPRIGTAGHWQIGVGFDGSIQYTNKVQLIYDLRYKYLLRANEQRILGLKNYKNEKLKWEPYMLLGQIESPKVIPAANILAQRVAVRPQSRVEGMFMFSYNKKHLSAQLGYDFWFKQRDDISPVRSWEDNRYGFASSSYLTDLQKIISTSTTQQLEANFALNDSSKKNTISRIYPNYSDDTSNYGTISAAQVDEAEAETPSVVSHKIFASLGYVWDEKNRSYFLSGGSAVELPQTNSRLIQLELWMKLGVIF
ncbi:TPA: hypothetical protein DEO28_03490 [Candidatus Dependentiae bacterium]|nr:MAG: hypothetical protein UR43_C0004G0181 [candidate division TM6 bacterium GW2011_GWF2_33_332]HBS48121.1 hypothetical protein [Candidatus Dependentiae bacterium]HBZ73545.1 hypothetical protein [Candidatus Dependentiae bacterium]